MPQCAAEWPNTSASSRGRRPRTGYLAPLPVLVTPVLPFPFPFVFYRALLSRADFVAFPHPAADSQEVR